MVARHWRLWLVLRRLLVESEAQQRRALTRLYDLAGSEVSSLLRDVSRDDWAAVRAALVEGLPLIADRYGLAAGALAADWYESLRDEAGVPGGFVAEIADLPDQGRYEALAGWAVDKPDMESLIAGGMQRIIANAHRETIMRSSFADPQAEGWARFGRGVETCSFCHMLISRGACYTERTAKFGSHDNCSCSAGPVWKGTEGARTVARYRQSGHRPAMSDETRAKANARAREWIADNL